MRIVIRYISRKCWAKCVAHVEPSAERERERDGSCAPGSPEFPGGGCLLRSVRPRGEGPKTRRFRGGTPLSGVCVTDRILPRPLPSSGATASHSAPPRALSLSLSFSVCLSPSRSLVLSLSVSLSLSLALRAPELTIRSHRIKRRVPRPSQI